MLKPVLELPENLNTKKSFLRELTLESFRVSQSFRDEKRSGFWSKVLNKSAMPAKGIEKSVSLRIELGGWVNLPPGVHDAVSLLLEYEDASGLHCFIVDEMNARGAAQVLLAGSVDLQLRGVVKPMRVFCGGIADRSVWIDSMHLKTSELESCPLQNVS